MEHKATGVTALKCAVCGNTVGVININAAGIMKRNDDVYICNQCRQLPEITIVSTLAKRVDIHAGTLATVEGARQ